MKIYHYYNEFNPFAAAWLRQLIKAKLIPGGFVDERSITEVDPRDLSGFRQCHFFAGIGGWPRALQLAGIPADVPLWTGSPPCQPFSVAGRQKGKYDERHLAPVFLRLIRERRPTRIYGEQVAAAIKKQWMCDLQNELERYDYAVGFTVLPACSVGAPHQRYRLLYGARSLVNADGRIDKREVRRSGRTTQAVRQPGVDMAPRQSGRTKPGGSMAYTDGDRRQGRVSGRTDPERQTICRPAGSGGTIITADQDNGFWNNPDWISCRDGKFRPIESGVAPLVNGLPRRMEYLRGYGNAIVPQVAAEFIRAFDGAFTDVSHDFGF